ncbi:MAG: putative peptidoglycan lipid flippase [Clostridia bacterium]|jgi:putative peptidoglycan lipid II flippase|nr:integral rane protein MviN [Clostridiales bacterium]MDK2985216.1 putative peptidoglycan lipid flippase [Clostridia bacterium]
MTDSNTAKAVVVKATGIVVLMNLISRILGFVRDAIIAKEFGASGATDAYLVAYTLPYALQAVLGMAFVSVIVPVITSYIVKDQVDEAWKAGSIILNWTFIILTVITALGLLFAPGLVAAIAPGFSPEQKLLTTRLTRIIFPSIIFMGSGMLLTGFLNARGIFGIPAFAPGLTNIIIILAVLFLGERYRIEGLAAGTLAGFIGFFLLQIPSLKKVGFKYFFSLNSKHPAVKKVAITVIPVTLSVAVNQAYLAVNRIFASGLQNGSITALDFAYRLMALPLGIFVMAVATAIYPELSRYAARGSHQELADSLLKGLKMVTLVSVPAAIGLIVLRFPLVKFVFERGAFTTRATEMTAEALLFFAVGLLGAGANLIITRAYYALDKVKVPFLVGLASVLVNVVLSFIFLPLLGHGGLALANSFAALTSVILLLVIFKSHYPVFTPGDLIISLFKITIASGIMGVIVWNVIPIFDTLLGDTFLALAIQLVLLAVCGAIIFAIIAYVFKVEELQEIMEIVLKKLKIS